jgi:hypothetical protein
MTVKATASEQRCARRMRLIEQGHLPVDTNEYGVGDIAERYEVHRDTVYKGVRAQSPLFPQGSRKGSGPKAWLYFSPEAILACDLRRIAFYRTTPSWHEYFGKGASAAPARRSAKALIAAPPEAGKKSQS